MNKLSAKLLCTTFSLLSISAQAGIQRSNIVYGEDNRIEIFQTSKEIQKLASSTAAMVMNHSTLNFENAILMSPASLKDSMNVCPNERFADQPAVASCSGFLVGPDLLVTAGHCINSTSDCSNVSWVFDYKVDERTGKTDFVVKKDKVYKCKNVLEAKLDMITMQDYSLIQLDRVVEGRDPLNYRTSEKVETNTDIFVIGHPSGLPSKYAAGASVLDNSAKHFFKSNLDTFGGNSGSAVFNERTNEVEGILVRGAKDYNYNFVCNAVNVVSDDITTSTRLGESVSRITDINTLKHRQAYLDAAKYGDLEKVKELLEDVKIYDIYDNELNSALHLASAYGETEVVEYLLSKFVEIDRQNIYGDTALHLAIVSGNAKIAFMLLDNGANPLLRNKMGKTVLDSTSFLQQRLKRKLKKYLQNR